MSDAADAAVSPPDGSPRVRERAPDDARDNAPRGGRGWWWRRSWRWRGWRWRRWRWRWRWRWRRWRRRWRWRRRRRWWPCGRHLSVVGIRLRHGPGVRPSVGPHDVRSVLSVERERHPVTEEPGLDRILGGRHVRHGRRGHARIVERGAARRRVVDLGQRDVVAARRLAIPVRPVVERDVEPASVRRDGAPRLPLRGLAESRVRARGDDDRLAPRLALVRRVGVEDVVIARRGRRLRPARAVLVGVVTEVGPDDIDAAVSVDRVRDGVRFGHPVRVRRKALQHERAPGVARSDGLPPDEV